MSFVNVNLVDMAQIHLEISSAVWYFHLNAFDSSLDRIVLLSRIKLSKALSCENSAPKYRPEENVLNNQSIKIVFNAGIF